MEAHFLKIMDIEQPRVALPVVSGLLFYRSERSRRIKGDYSDLGNYGKFGRFQTDVGLFLATLDRGVMGCTP